MKTDRISCAVCPKSISPGLLMCLPHWRMVPTVQQTEVLKTYGRWMRHKGARDAKPALIAEYRKARDAAVASVEAALKPSATGDL